jgi:hypothetical protein
MVNVYGGRDWSAATRDSSNFLGLLNASSATFEGLYIVYKELLVDYEGSWPRYFIGRV